MLQHRSKEHARNSEQTVFCHEWYMEAIIKLYIPHVNDDLNARSLSGSISKRSACEKIRPLRFSGTALYAFWLALRLSNRAD